MSDMLVILNYSEYWIICEIPAFPNWWDWSNIQDLVGIPVSDALAYFLNVSY